MTKIKFCGMRSLRDIELANELLPDYVGFVLAPRFWRHIDPDSASKMKAALDPKIRAVGVFVDNPFEEVADYLSRGIIDIAQLHGAEDEDFIRRLQKTSGKPVIKAFKIESEEDVKKAQNSPADFVLLDSGTGTGKLFDWSLIENFGREFFLAGGLNPENAAGAIKKCSPYAVDVSSGIETDKVKDPAKMRSFAKAVRGYSI